MNLYRDATGVVVGTQAEAKAKGKGWTPLEVPVDKQGLIDWINTQTSSVIIEEVADQSAPALMPRAYESALPAMQPRAPLTQERVDEMFEPRVSKPLPRDTVCEAISTYKGADLGFIALEVAARYEALAKA